MIERIYNKETENVAVKKGRKRMVIACGGNPSMFDKNGNPIPYEIYMRKIGTKKDA
jgi:hypothetical protein